ncbi:MAG TPA: putative baseplate assembly protein [Candidatus Binatia bacterium]|nr:putative baseplate assembly protein [Candidatus Binatia bacterium]
MSCSGGSGCDCGCCAGTSVQTPQTLSNLPGLSSISYRVGRWATFKDSMLARLSSSDYPALNALKTRDDDDFTIAFLDATSVVLDILSFYQERLANESYLRTAGQLRSLVELSRLIGYEPAPGVAAAAYVAFTLKAAPGQAPDPSAPAITIPQGTQMQSVPAQGQMPQTFETSADIPAKPDWNALPVQTGMPWTPQINDFGVYLQGTATQLNPGDLILIVGDERAGDPTNNNWDVRAIATVTPDGANNRTYVTWSEGLGYAPDGIQPAQAHPKFYAFRQRAALFGYNAVTPVMLSNDTIGNLQTAHLITGPPASNPEWVFGAPSTTTPLIDLDAVYGKIVPDGWIALIRPDAENTRTPAGFVTLNQVKSITAITRSGYAVSAKISRATVDTTVGELNPYYAVTRETAAAAQSEQLVVPLQPLRYPLCGKAVALEDLRPDLAQATVIAISGKRQKLSVNTTGLQFVPDDATGNVSLNVGDLLTLTGSSAFVELAPGDWSSGSGPLTLPVEDASGRPGTVQADLTNFVLAPSTSQDPEVSECALVQTATEVPGAASYTLFTLQSALMNCYERATTTVNCNVVMATNGRSVSEVMGSGSASTPNQNFTLKQSPLTYVQAATPTGRQSTLQVQVSGVDWTEVPTLYRQSPSAQVFETLNQSDGTTDAIFGDGVEGATLPTGQNNLQANYRIGSGSAGNVAAGALSTLMDRPLGVGGVTNPQAATGGQDAQSVDDIRSNAPQTVLTLGRAVSITDYQSYAATFAGISKAYAIWIPSGPGRGVFLTVAGVNGEALPASSPTMGYLIDSLQSYGNPLIPITVVSFLETLFSLSADVQYDPLHDQPTVQAQILATLSETYSFANRTFGQGVSSDEIAAVVQGVPGVIAVNVTSITPGVTSAAGDLASQGGAFTITKLNNWLAQQISPPLPRPTSDPSRICPYLPIPSLTALPQPAEILVLDPDPTAVSLGVMS